MTEQLSGTELNLCLKGPPADSGVKFESHYFSIFFYSSQWTCMLASLLAVK